MKKFIVTFASFLLALLLWAVVGMKRVDNGLFLSKTVLDSATPLDVNIDVEFIKGLNPAYGK